MYRALTAGLLVLGAGSCSWVDAGSSAGPLSTLQHVTFHHGGFGGGPVLFTGDGGNLVEERRHDPFGVPIGAADVAARDLNPLNKRTEPATGWSVHGARWLAPETARWLTTDPPVGGPDAAQMDAPWQLHPYQYVNQNPVVFWDPDGREPAPKTCGAVCQRRDAHIKSFTDAKALAAERDAYLQSTIQHKRETYAAYDKGLATNADRQRALAGIDAAYDRAVAADAARDAAHAKMWSELTGVQITRAFKHRDGIYHGEVGVFLAPVSPGRDLAGLQVETYGGQQFVFTPEDPGAFMALKNHMFDSPNVKDRVRKLGKGPLIVDWADNVRRDAPQTRITENYVSP